MDKLKREQRKYKLLKRKFPVEKKRDLENFMKSSPLSPADVKIMFQLDMITSQLP